MEKNALSNWFYFSPSSLSVYKMDCRLGTHLYSTDHHRHFTTISTPTRWDIDRHDLNKIIITVVWPGNQCCPLYATGVCQSECWGAVVATFLDCTNFRSRHHIPYCCHPAPNGSLPWGYLLLCCCPFRSRSNTANRYIKDSLPYPILPHITYLWLIAALEETRSRSALSSSRTRHTNQDKENALQVSPSCVFLLS